MERICGDFQRNLRSKSSPWSNLNKRVLHGAYLDQLESRFDLGEELEQVGCRPPGSLTRGEKVFPDCKYSNLINITLIHAIHR